MNTARDIQNYCEAYRAAWQGDSTRPAIETMLLQANGIDTQALFGKLLETEIELRCARGQQPTMAEYFERFPQFRSQIIAVFTDIGTQRDVRPAGTDAQSQHRVVDDLPERADQQEPPGMIGRYRLRKRLGEGGFGIVYLAEDEKLERLVAIKVPRRAALASVSETQEYLNEARAVARLDHPHIVPVYDVGSSEQYPCYVVSKYIDGSNLAARIKRERLTLRETVELVETVASALHFSHKQGLVHRDIKPGNILLDSRNKPYVTDFGLALREQDIGKIASYAGTPMYMSPEQARGEGHRVDGRSDIFSLGVVLYELLTGRRPFRAESANELREQITTEDAKPPRQIDDTIPRELERICLKAMSKRTMDRYTTARDFADDLRLFLEDKEHARLPQLSEVKPGPEVHEPASTQPSSASTTGMTSQGAAIKVVPKGLRSFDARDADFFLDLLPGPRDREGFPEAIRFWKTRIEETDADQTFMIGLLYGPSGCGKSSLVKAGLLPRLSSDVTTVFVESTAQETESRLLAGMRKRCPALEEKWGLRESIAGLRRGYGVPSGKKVLIVLDQFEQWLHGRKDEVNTRLLQALRHCDGSRVQCMILVRDDFWLAVSRFMRQLEVELSPGKNIQLVDLFDADHARKVLCAFGKAFGKLPEDMGLMSDEQKQFIKQAVKELSEENRVICVRLALFAEMMKNRPWTPTTLREVGGTAGLGVRFLEETFSSPHANPAYREHQKAVRAVLQALLPEPGRAIKGNMKSQEELLNVSGYEQAPGEFSKLLRILDQDLRLITPTDPEGNDVDAERASVAPGKTYYQLTHDYLVHSLREWLTWKQKETRSGRAELLLAERASYWKEHQESRHLPSLGEYLRFRLLTNRRTWSLSQQDMMQHANRYYLSRSAAILVMLLALSWGTWAITGRQHARSLHDRLLSADVAAAAGIVEEMEGYRSQVEPMLRTTLAGETDAKRKLLLSLALVKSDSSQVPFLMERMLQAGPGEFGVIRDALSPAKSELKAALWNELGERERAPERRFRAACALANFDSSSDHWKFFDVFLLDQLLVENPLYLSYWQEAMMPIRHKLLPRIAQMIEENPGNVSERRSLIEFFRYFAKGEASSLGVLEGRQKADRSASSTSDRRRREANVAAALASLDQPDGLWPMLKHGNNPTTRSFLIEQLGTSNISLSKLLERFLIEPDVSVRRALLLSIPQFPQATYHVVANKVPLLELFEHDPDAGIHSAIHWVMKKWGRQSETQDIEARLATGELIGHRRWYINKERQTFSVIEMGSSKRLAVCTTEMTVEQFRRFRHKHEYDHTYSSTPDSPVNRVTWHDAAAYCNWLTAQDPRLGPTECCYVSTHDGMKPVAGFEKMKGYRLPLPTEWEVTCAAGCQTDWHFGEYDKDLLNAYAWNASNGIKNGIVTSFGVGQLKCNDYGLFDMHGNVQEMCHEGKAVLGSVPNESMTTYRGGSSQGRTGTLKGIDIGDMLLPKTVRLANIGFRIVRSMD